MKLIPLPESRLNEAVAFSAALCSRPELQSCPLFEAPEAIREEYAWRFHDKNGGLMAAEEDGLLAAVFCFFFLPEQRYLQTTSFHIAPGREEAGRLFFAHLAAAYPGFRMNVILPVQNRPAETLLKQEGFQLQEECIDQQLKLSTLPQTAPADDVLAVEAENFDRYAPFHDAWYPGYFWTAELLKANPSGWEISALQEGETLTGSVLLRCDGDLFEIFGLHAPDDEAAARLLSTALARSRCRHPEGRVALFGVEPDNARNLRAAKACGFSMRSHYRCWSKAL